MRLGLLTFIVLGILVLIGIAAAPAFAGFEKGDFELSLTGSGVTPADGGSFTTAANVGIGHFLTDNIEIGVRQSIGYSDVNGSTWVGATTGFTSFNFNVGEKWTPFIGGFGGAQYGDGLDCTWVAGPEAGIRYWLSEDTAIVLSAQYGFNLTDPDQDGSFVYALGLNLRF